MEPQEKIEEVIKRLRNHFIMHRWWENTDYTPFEIMVAIILSQRCHYKLVAMAMIDFRDKYRDPEEVVRDPTHLDSIIKRTGYRKNKISAVIGLSKTIIDNGGIDLFLKSDPEAVRHKLLSIKGIGEKTADVILMALYKFQVFPVDVHILRIMKRLGIVSKKDDIYSARRKVEPLIPPRDRAYLHAALVSYGQRICRSKFPICSRCILEDICEISKERV